MDVSRFEKISKALAEPMRVKLLRRVASSGEVGCGALVAEMPVGQATVSHHLKELANAGLLEGRRDGQCTVFRARLDVLEEYLAEMRRTVSGL